MTGCCRRQIRSQRRCASPWIKPFREQLVVSVGRNNLVQCVVRSVKFLPDLLQRCLLILFPNGSVQFGSCLPGVSFGRHVRFLSQPCRFRTTRASSNAIHANGPARRGCSYLGAGTETELDAERALTHQLPNGVVRDRVCWQSVVQILFSVAASSDRSLAPTH